MTTIDPLVAQLRNMRGNCGLTRKQVAERAGVSAAHISSWERGVTTPRLPELRRWAEALDAYPTLGHYEPPPPPLTAADEATIDYLLATILTTTVDSDVDP